MRVCGQITEFSTRARSSTKATLAQHRVDDLRAGFDLQSSPIIDKSSISATVAASNSASFLDMNSRDADCEQSEWTL
jgi:hypothetical protein